ncbi:MAG: glutathione S-transferase C-terminal domain-containing protein, partial [Deltaproteobacteria bacterium]|nr:glutathione S-transferase C-terminal domain-containing protein [Deltaproteobacteria bacterium]MBW2547571.1 glutathione S-transferase C-terminal domain-containing protein [Deltaproteobacteria bacterium]
MAAHERIVEERLGELEALLGQQTWIAGETYSLADAVWTAGLGRLVFFELEPTTGRPAFTKLGLRWAARPNGLPTAAEALLPHACRRAPRSRSRPRSR